MALADTAELVVALTLRDRLSGGLRNLNGQLKGMQGGLRDVSRGIGQVGSGLDRIATRGAVAAIGGLTAVVTTAASFEQAFTGVEKTVDGTDAQLKELEDTVREMARTMPISFEELAGIGEAGGALGIARDSIDEFIDVVARLSVSTDLTSEAAATALGQLGNVLHLTGDDFEDFADSLVALGNAGASTESQIVEMAARFGAAGNSAGLSKEEILALSSAVASMGIEVEAGGSSLSRIFGNVATAIGTGGDEVEAFTDLLGISADEFRKQWSEDALGTFQDFLGELGKLDQFAQAKVLEEAGITGVRDINAVRLMAQNVGFLSDQLEIAEEATGALDKESQKFFDTTQGQWKILQNNVRDAGATIGAELLPVVNEVMGDLVEWLQDPATQRGLADFADSLAGGVRDLVAEVRNADFGPLLDTLKGAASVAKGAFDAFRALPEPIQQLALAAIVANKVSGGAVGSIAAGLGNILKGVIKIGFDRGSSPINPMWVKQVGLPGGGGGPGTPTTGGGRGRLPLLGAAGAVGVALSLSGSDNPTAQEFVDRQRVERGEMTQEDFDRLWNHGEVAKNISDLAGRSMGGSFGPTTDAATAASGAEWEQVQRDISAALSELDNEAVIRELAKTTEIGLKDIGTTFQVGLTTGMDPVGDVATGILQMAQNPKAPPVMAEIQGHLAGLEEIQQTYLNRGDIALAQQVQKNIDTLHGLIGTADTLRSVTERMAADAASSDAAMLQTARTQTNELRNTKTAVSQLPPKFDGTNARLAGLGTKIDGANTQLARVAAKNFSPVINLTPRFNLSTSVLAWGTTSYKSVVGAPQRIL